MHGDYRTGNFLYDAGGDIRAILDWEMAHLGDPLEDIGWAVDPLWSHGDPSHPAGGIAREDGFAVWEKASGLTIDREALTWWEIFASLKGLAIWISAAKEYTEGRNTEAVNAFSGWYCLAFHNKVLADATGTGVRRMKPEVDQILMITAGQIMGELTPNLPSHYTQGAAQLAALMAILSAQEYDRAAEIRAAENREMRALFAELAPGVSDAALRAKLEAAAKGDRMSACASLRSIRTITACANC